MCLCSKRIDPQTNKTYMVTLGIMSFWTLSKHNGNMYCRMSVLHNSYRNQNTPNTFGHFLWRISRILRELWPYFTSTRRLKVNIMRPLPPWILFESITIFKNTCGNYHDLMFFPILHIFLGDDSIRSVRGKVHSSSPPHPLTFFESWRKKQKYHTCFLVHSLSFAK